MLKTASIRTKYSFVSAAVVIISVVVTGLVCLLQIRADLVRQANVQLGTRLKAFEEILAARTASTGDPGSVSGAGKFRLEGDKLMIGSTTLNDNYEFVDRIKDIFGGAATIFMKDVRISTNVPGKDGGRAVGTKLQAGPAYTAVFEKGLPYRGETTILGAPYFAAYDPIKSPTGEVIGVLFVGAPKHDFFESFDRIALTMLVVAVLLIGIVCLFVTMALRKTTAPLMEGVAVANRLAEGDLTATVAFTSGDEVGRLFDALRHMTGNWRQIVEKVTGAAGSMNTASAGLGERAARMSEGSSVQAESLSQVAAASEQMSGMVANVAKDASDIARSAAETVLTAQDGESIVARAVEEVREISLTVEESAGLVKSLGDKSSQIGTIVGVINDIADQTNLLALNAAIEAARAGESGRGFAVVADEVRKLAERTAQATAEIGAMIGAIQREVGRAVTSMDMATGKVEAGVTLSARAGTALQKIIKAVNELQAMVERIAGATGEMTESSDRINQDIERIASVSHEISVTSDHTNQAAGELSSMSASLQEVVRGFRLA